MLAAIDSLTLSRHAPIAALIRIVLWRAAASSPAALDGSLRRYRSLLLNARDATAAGHAPDRAALQRFTAGVEDQLMMWELLPSVAGCGDLYLGDLATLDGLISAAECRGRSGDGKVARLRRLLEDRRPSLVFTSARETVRYLRDHLRDPHLAWCTGARAGIGHTALPRRTVLDWFQPGAATPVVSGVPRTLVTTDVAAEGLNLQGAARVVHYDLPWTPMRLEQREGRAVRAGSRHQAVEVVRFATAPALEARLRQLAILAAKSTLPTRLGVGDEGRSLWQWRAEAGERMGAGGAVEGVATVESAEEGALVGFSLAGVDADGGRTRLDGTVVWLDEEGEWSDDVDLLQERLFTAAQRHAIGAGAPADARSVLHRVAPLIRERMRAATGRRWSAIERGASARVLIRRLQRLSHDAVRRRDARDLELVERAVRFAAGGHTAGEAELVRRLGSLGDRELRRALRVLPTPTKVWRSVEVVLTGIILFRSPSASLRCPK